MTQDDIMISEQIVNEFVSKFNNLTQEEKRRVFSGILETDRLAVDNLETILVLFSLLLDLHTKYSIKHPDVKIETLYRALFKGDEGIDFKWLDNILPLCLELKGTFNKKKTSSCGSKSVEDYKTKIKSILDCVLPF